MKLQLCLNSHFSELEVRELPSFHKAGKTRHRFIAEPERQEQAQRKDQLSSLMLSAYNSMHFILIWQNNPGNLVTNAKNNPGKHSGAVCESLSSYMRQELYIELAFNFMGVCASQGSLPLSLLCTSRNWRCWQQGWLGVAVGDLHVASGILLTACTVPKYIWNLALCEDLGFS